MPCKIFWSHQKACNEHATCELRLLEREIARRHPQPARSQQGAEEIRSDAWVADRTANSQGTDSDEPIPPGPTQLTTGGWKRESVAADVTDQDTDLALFLPPPSVETQVGLAAGYHTCTLLRSPKARELIHIEPTAGGVALS